MQPALCLRTVQHKRLSCVFLHFQKNPITYENIKITSNLTRNNLRLLKQRNVKRVLSTLKSIISSLCSQWYELWVVFKVYLVDSDPAVTTTSVEYRKCWCDQVSWHTYPFSVMREGAGMAIFNFQKSTQKHSDQSFFWINAKRLVCLI